MKTVKDYNEYVRQSKAAYGRASGEPVTLFRNGEIVRERHPRHARSR
jgi:hypothetical protein